MNMCTSKKSFYYLGPIIPRRVPHCMLPLTENTQENILFWKNTTLLKQKVYTNLNMLIQF